MNNMYQQAHLANFAPDQSLDKYKKGADPRVINGIMALSEMQDRAADRMHGNLAAGAASGQMPTVRDKIMQMFQQANQQQPQQQPNPMMQQGIAARAHPQMQTAPMPEEEEQPTMQARAGGLARLPVNDRMFGYANGGIIAFAGKDNDQEVPLPVGQETPLSPEERARLERELEMRLIGEGERARNAPAPEPTTSSPPDLAQRHQMAVEGGNASTSPTRDRSTSMAGDIGRGIMSVLGKAGSGISEFAGNLNRQRELNRERLAQVPGFFEALTPEQRAERQTKMRELGQQIDANQLVSTAAPAAAPAAAPKERQPQLNEIERLNQGIMSGGEGRGIRLTPQQMSDRTSGPKRVGGNTYEEAIRAAEERNGPMDAESRAIFDRRWKGAIADPGTGIKTLPEAKPPRTQVQVPGGPTAPPSAPPTAAGEKPPTIDQLLEQQRNLLQAANAPVGPQLPEKSITEKATDYLAAQDEYVRKTGDSEAAKKLSALYDKAEKRALADDDAQAAQRAADARNNLWSFLSNTRGSSLATAAGKADAALQPLLAEQKKTNAEYRKYSYERDMNRDKARVEAIAAEDARKRGEFAKAIEHEQKERTYTLEAQKAKDLADHYKRSDTNTLLNTLSVLQGHRESNLTQLEIARIREAAQLAGYNKPGETERLMAEYEKRVKEQGQKAADAWLDNVGKITGITKGYNLKEEGLDVQRDKAVTAALKDYDPYNRALQKIASLESRERAGKLTPKQQAELEAARAAAKKYYDDKYQEIHRTRPPASAGNFTVTTPQGTFGFKTQAEADAFRAKIGG